MGKPKKAVAQKQSDHPERMKQVTGLRQVAVLLGESLQLIRAAKYYPATTHCFLANSTTDVQQLKPLLDKYRKELEELANSSGIEAWKERKLRADALLAEIDLDQAKLKFLDKNEVIAFLKQIASAQKALLRSRLVHELPPKLLGLGVVELSVAMENEVDTICKIFSEGMDRWK